jgi:hypothetical protein
VVRSNYLGAIWECVITSIKEEAAPNRPYLFNIFISFSLGFPPPLDRSHSISLIQVFGVLFSVQIVQGHVLILLYEWIDLNPHKAQRSRSDFVFGEKPVFFVWYEIRVDWLGLGWWSFRNSPLSSFRSSGPNLVEDGFDLAASWVISCLRRFFRSSVFGLHPDPRIVHH